MLRRTKIVTTLGPATDREGVLEGILEAGANMVRMNFSHGTAEDHIARAKEIRALAARLGKSVAILGDLQGPKIRVSTFKDNKIMLKVGDKFLLDAELELLQNGLVQPGDLVIMTVGDVVGQVNTTNTMKIIKVGGRK